jgi:hypothetical protein
MCNAKPLSDAIFSKSGIIFEPNPIVKPKVKIFRGSGVSPVTCSIGVLPSKENDELEVKDMTLHAHTIP